MSRSMLANMERSTKYINKFFLKIKVQNSVKIVNSIYNWDKKGNKQKDKI